MGLPLPTLWIVLEGTKTRVQPVTLASLRRAFFSKRKESQRLRLPAMLPGATATHITELLARGLLSSPHPGAVGHPHGGGRPCTTGAVARTPATSASESFVRHSPCSPILPEQEESPH